MITKQYLWYWDIDPKFRFCFRNIVICNFVCNSAPLETDRILWLVHWQDHVSTFDLSTQMTVFYLLLSWERIMRFLTFLLSLARVLRFPKSTVWFAFSILRSQFNSPFRHFLMSSDCYTIVWFLHFIKSYIWWWFYALTTVNNTTRVQLKFKILEWTHPSRWRWAVKILEDSLTFNFNDQKRLTYFDWLSMKKWNQEDPSQFCIKCCSAVVAELSVFFCFVCLICGSC